MDKDDWLYDKLLSTLFFSLLEEYFSVNFFFHIFSFFLYILRFARFLLEIEYGHFRLLQHTV